MATKQKCLTLARKIGAKIETNYIRQYGYYTIYIDFGESREGENIYLTNLGKEDLPETWKDIQEELLEWVEELTTTNSKGE